MWKDIVRKLAPTLGAALGGPLAGAGVKFIADKLLGKPDANEGDIASFILGASPEQLAELKRIDNDFAVKMRELEIDVFKIEVEDRQGARQLFNVNMWPQIILSALFLVGYFTLLGLLISGSLALPQDTLTLVTALIGVITAGVTGIMQFWFGSSAGSKEKTAKLKT